MENWTKIEGFNGVYEISDLGRCKRIKAIDLKGRQRKEKILKPCHTGDGYYSYYLYGDNGRVAKKAHRLVAKAFISNSENKPEVNHKNKNRSDNVVNNLEWATESENVKHSYANGTRVPYWLGKNNPYAKAAIKANKKKVKCDTLNIEFDSVMETADKLGICFTLISAVCRGNRKFTHGLTFRYI
jgi:hypothetical protein